MVSPPPLLNRTILRTLAYSDRYGYALTAAEVWFWQISTEFSLTDIRRSLTSAKISHLGKFYFLSDRHSYVLRRRSFYTFSRSKWIIARRVCRVLSRLPTVAAVYVTGSLAMDNTPQNDDIDLMIVSLPHTLWLTRGLVAIFLIITRQRRSPGLPEHSSPRVKDKICDNLYLDLTHLQIHRSLYLAHEILQAKPVIDKYQIHPRFLLTNSWVKSYLPIAYLQTTRKFKTLTVAELLNSNFNILSIFLSPLNYLAYLIQKTYMSRRHTTEIVSLHQAFFHPRSQSVSAPYLH